MTVRAKLGNLLIRFVAGGTARLLDLPRPSERLMKSVARTQANGHSLDAKIGDLEDYWRDVLHSWNDASILMGATMLAKGDDPGLGDVFLRPATAVLLLRELKRRWATEAADEVRTNVEAGATRG